MRHTYTNRLAATMTALLLAASAVFAFAALRSSDATGARVDTVLGIAADLDAGRDLYVESLDPPCARCHSLSDAGADSDAASDLDRVEPTGREVVVSILGGQIGAHEAQGYRLDMSDRQIADLSAYVEAAAGS